MQRDSAIRAAAVFQEATEVLGSTVASQSRHASRHPSPAYSPPLHTHTHEHHRSSGSRIHSPHRPGGIKSSLPTAYLHDHLGAQDVDGKLVAELLSESQQSSDPLPTEIIQHINQLTAQCSALQTSNARLLAEKDHLVEEKEVLVEEKEQLVEEKEQLVEEKEQLVEEKEHLIEEKENLAQEKEVLVEEKEHLIEEKEHLLELKEHLAEEKDSLLTEKHHLVQEKDHLAQQKDHLLSEKDHLLSEKDHLLSEKSHLAQQKDHLAEENSHLRYQIGVGARRTSDLLDKSMISDKRAERLSMETERMGEEIMDLAQRNRDLVERSGTWLGPVHAHVSPPAASAHVPAPAHGSVHLGEGDRIVLPPIKHQHLVIPSSSSRSSSHSPPKREYRRLPSGSKPSPPRLSDTRTPSTSTSDARMSDTRTSSTSDALLDTSMPPPSLISDGSSTRMSYSRRRTPDLPRLDTGPALDDQVCELNL
ncbi:hypothetical protein BDV98DRAFT_38525 [Pterulicium gracile]|uniref:Uncharacterized protein n=1 Tax=Pterulicium gracile TaxID=1884261 RepID=A0A5C3R0V9_9AGAR|nr:hypothetical protein BDV98DRAFT_38525 [Pterula gracilis]